MLEKSELLNRRKCEHCSLCERCRAENTEAGWGCSHMDTTPFLRQKIFLQASGRCSRCWEKYAGAGTCPFDLLPLPPDPVHAGYDAFGYHRHEYLRCGFRNIPFHARPHFRQCDFGRRDQPYHSAYPVQSAGVHGRKRSNY